MRSKINLTAICILILFSIDGYAQELPFSKGVNLTNWFQANSSQQVQIKKYDLEDFRNIKDLGCDVIRLPVNLIAMTYGEPDYEIDPLFYTLLDSVIHWAEITDLHLILDNHTFDPSIPTPPDFGVFLNKVWAQIANYYKSGYDKLYFEILNEPHGIVDDLWNNMQQSVVETIREIDSNHFIIVGPAGWNSYNNLENMPEYTGQKLIYTFHFYDPFIFTHQGATWVDPSMDKIVNIPFPYQPETMPVMDPKYEGTWLGWAFNEYPHQGNEDFVKQLLDKAISFKNERGVPIFCGEFGVLKTHAINEERANWYRIVRAYMESNDIGWTMWDYHGAFGIFRSGTNGLFEHDLNLELVEALDLNEVDQTEFYLFPDSNAFIIYDDFIGKNIEEEIYTNGSLSLYATDNPKLGNFYIKWENPDQYNHLTFNFRPDKDLSLLLENDYRVEFWLKADKPGAKLDLRFTDTKTGVDDDKPWRIRYVIKENEMIGDGNWQKLSIPLKEFVEQGSWDDNTWYDPIGAFDWTAIDHFEIVDEYGAPHPVSFGFDQIEIVGETLNSGPLINNMPLILYPNPGNNSVQLKNLKEDCNKYYIFDVKGNLIMEAEWTRGQKLDTNLLKPGIYIINFYNVNKFVRSVKFVKT